MTLISISTYPEDSAKAKANFGTCCVCEVESKDVNNFVMLPYKAPIPGTGWGCFVCDMDSDGAISVMCNECLIKLNYFEVEIKFVIEGFPRDKKRKPLENYLKIPFMHNPKLHDQYEGWTSTIGIE